MVEGRSWLSALTKDEFKVLMTELAGELRPILVAHYSGYYVDRIAESITRQLAANPEFNKRVVEAVLLLAADPITAANRRPLSDAESAALLSTMDARKWAAAFCQATGLTDESWALSWFANAIMAGHDAARRGEGA